MGQGADVNIKPIYTVPELARMMALTTKRALRLLARAGVPVQPGDPRMVYLSDLKAMAPEIWTSMEEAAHIKAIAG